MPVMDGLAAIQELRRMQASGEITGHIPVLAVTANAREEQLETVSFIPETVFLSSSQLMCFVG